MGRAVQRAKVAVSVIFVVNGLAFASWAARVPAIRDTLGLTPGRVGLLLLAVSAGDVGVSRYLIVAGSQYAMSGLVSLTIDASGSPV